MRITAGFIGLLTLLAGSASGQSLTPREAIQRMQVPPGMEVRLVASEPQIRQPLSMFFDGKGRLWVLQYLQYPNPAGLKPVKQDQYLRTIWDRIPEPPPKGPKGIDKITILSDRDENGLFRKSKDFVTGLSLASGMIWGHGGLFVANPPYLLFYPDKNQDDIPDGDPEVLLEGFGMEDSHAYVNSLQWGPDGWLYGAQGSTVTAKVRGIEFQQGIWRYHPITREFELFSEGGGNTWGLDFDATGQIIAGTNYGNHTMLHQVQGAYYVKGFAKHGPLHNPHTYGYFDHVPFKNFKGGHVTNGGIIYQADLYPPSFRNKYIAGNLLSNDIYFHDISPTGSTFSARFDGDFLLSKDPWFRPVDCFQGPEGAVYIADWHDKRAAHLDPVDNWDRTNGRIYKVVPSGFKEISAFDLAANSSAKLLQFLTHPNVWYSREARRILAERRDAEVAPALKNQCRSNSPRIALESLWALAGMGMADEPLLLESLNHANSNMREWAARLLLDHRKKQPAPSAIHQLVELSRTETAPNVLAQLACTSRRIDSDQALSLIKSLYQHDQMMRDPFYPMLLWWAVEDRAIRNRSQILDWFTETGFWQRIIVRQNLLERISRRWISEGTQQDWEASARLLDLSPDPESRKFILAGMEKALEGRRLALVPTPMEKPLVGLLNKNPSDRDILRLAFRLGSEPAYTQIAQLARSPGKDQSWAIDLLSQAASHKELPFFLSALEKPSADPVRLSALNALASFKDETVGKALLAQYSSFTPSLKQKALSLLSQRESFALELLKGIDSMAISKTDISMDLARSMASFKEPRIQELLKKHWGKVAPPSPGEKIARISYVQLVVNRSKPDPMRGKELFKKQCATCHILFGEGSKVGPDLTTSDRKSLLPLVTHVVDPSAYIRPEFIAQVVETKDGRTLTGLLAEETSNSITLIDAKNQRTTLSREKVETMASSPKSIMPDNILDTLTDQDIADLFSYLRSNPPPKP